MSTSAYSQAVYLKAHLIQMQSNATNVHQEARLELLEEMVDGLIQGYRQHRPLTR